MIRGAEGSSWIAALSLVEAGVEVQDVLPYPVDQQNWADQHVIEYLAVAIVNVRKPFAPALEVDQVYQGDLS